jgi:hypothetical protein
MQPLVRVGATLTRRAALSLIVGAGVATSFALAAGSNTLAATVPVSMQDYWSQLEAWQTTTGWWAAPVHVSLQQDGSLLFHGGTRSDRVWVNTTAAGIEGFRMVPGSPTASVTVTSIDEPVDIQLLTAGPWNTFDNLLCAGHAHMADGSVFIAGGTRSFLNSTTSEYFAEGLAYSTRSTATDWVRLAGNMLGAPPGEQPARWYPTVTRLADGRMLVAGGADLVSIPSPNLTAESYTPAAGTWAMISTYSETPSEIWNRDYTHTFVLPRTIGGYELVSLGEPGVAVFNTPVTPPPWRVSQTFRPGSDAYQAIRKVKGTFNGVDGPNFGASTVMLPLRLQDGEWGYDNGSLLTVGGPEGSIQSHSADIYSPVTDTWRASIDIGAQRHHPSTVLLPSGQVLIVNGTSADAGVTSAHYINLMDGLSSHPGADAGGDLRGYHSVAILLPDGRVLVGGGRNAADDLNTERADFRYYYPVYMFAPRPRITTAPASIGLGATFTIRTTGNQPVEVVLTGLGSMTHAVDMNQRWIQLKLVSAAPDGAGGFTCTIQAPASPQLAPPGPYLLWVLDVSRTPSVSAPVLLSAAGAAPAARLAPTFVRGTPTPPKNVARHIAQLKKRVAASGRPAIKPEFTCPLPTR